MGVVEVLLLALALALDALTVGAAVGLRACNPRQVFRLSFHFGVFQALMPVLGALLGRAVVGWIAGFTHWVAFGLLLAVGGKMIWGALRKRDECAEVCAPGDPTRGWSLVMLSLATSIDALGAGVGMGVLMGWLELAWAVAVIGVVAGLATWLGMRAGGALVCRLGRKAEALAGLVLVGLGVRMLLG
ncbi:MAG TPA: manganese efflux pump MntP family protein [Myxococcota bacterium]|nr:manganese efflux pump MntP family protein [Myxococcota bacterium]HRY95049.1 manganese efflux pump MntP family protein [Myxococcota bacterium]HSA20478.1 manganese efflux pump MntP family protein [Myxococcota bacterium]